MDRIDFLKSLDFTEYESKAISSLLSLGIATPKQISLNSGVPQNKLYPLIKKLEKESLLSLVPAETKKYKLLNFKTNISKRISDKESRLKEIKSLSKEIEQIEEPNNEALISIVKSQEAIMEKLSEQNNKVKHEILGVQRNWKVWAGGLREMEKSIKSGVKVKLIGVINDETLPRAKEWKSLGCKIRKFNNKFGQFPLRFTIFDNKEARLTIGKPEIQDPKDYITIWTKSKPLIVMLRKQFMEMWDSSEKF